MATRRTSKFLRLIPEILFAEDSDGVTVKAGRHRAYFPSEIETSRHGDKRPARERAEEHAEFLRRSFKRGKPSYRFNYSPRGAATADEYNERRALEYARWLAARDGVTISEGLAERAEWSGITDASGKWRKRICAVEFGTKFTERHGTGRKAYTSQGWRMAARIEIPNWDFDPAEPVEEIITNEMPLAPVTPSFRIPARFLLTTCLAPVNDRLPVAPSCAIRVAA